MTMTTVAGGVDATDAIAIGADDGAIAMPAAVTGTTAMTMMIATEVAGEGAAAEDVEAEDAAVVATVAVAAAVAVADAEAVEVAANATTTNPAPGVAVWAP
ncbi:MAG: hypothetical protein AAGB11_09155 [Pseudomonadota bacterium]